MKTIIASIVIAVCALSFSQSAFAYSCTTSCYGNTCYTNCL
jgi:hypothetical protein